MDLILILFDRKSRDSAYSPGGRRRYLPWSRFLLHLGAVSTALSYHRLQLFLHDFSPHHTCHGCGHHFEPNTDVLSRLSSTLALRSPEDWKRCPKMSPEDFRHQYIVSTMEGIKCSRSL